LSWPRGAARPRGEAGESSVSARACTMFARRELPRARVLAASFAEHHPGERLLGVLLDDAAGAIDGADEPFELVRSPHLGPHEGLLHRRAAAYAPEALPAALAPFLLPAVLRDVELAGLLPVESLVLGPLTRLLDEAEAHGVVLVPRVPA